MIVLPPRVATLYRQQTGRDPELVGRSLYTWDGRLGETYVAADAEGVSLFSRRLGEPYETQRLAWTEVDSLTCRVSSAFAWLELRSPVRTCSLQFTCWDAPLLKQMVALWEAKHGPPASPAPAAPPTSAKSVRASAALQRASVLTLFCAAMHAMIESDAHVDPQELQYLTHLVPDPEAVQQGHEVLQQSGLDLLGAELQQRFTPEQKRCLFANLTAVMMVDGLLRPAEQELLDRFQQWLQIDPATRERIYSVLLTKDQLSVLAEESAEGASSGLSPLVAFAAAMLALMRADGEVNPAEETMLHWSAVDPETLKRAQALLYTQGLDWLLARLPEALNDAQKRCVLANLIAAAMADGLLRPSEMELLEQFRQRLGVSEQEFATLYETLLMKNDLRPFAA